MSDPSPEDDRGQVLRFRQRTSDNPPGGATPPPDLGLRKFEESQDLDDYKSRMIVNLVALCFLALLIGAGLWIATTMAEMRKNQDCVLSGRRNCAPGDAGIERR